MKTQLLSHRWRPGLTLIETAVVVTVSSGALALLLPSFKDAREAAKLQTCLSNLGQVNRAFIGYTHDLGTLPLYVTGDCWASWTFGGWSGRNRAFWETESLCGNVQTADRPLSVYMTPWQIPEEVDRFTPTQEMPLFKCPSDRLSSLWQWNDGLGQISAYDDLGTSYHANWHWWEQVQGLSCSGVPAGFACWQYRGQQLTREYMDKAPSQFITLMEDPLDYGFGVGGESTAGVQVEGLHGEFSRHVVGFADGSAQYLYIDSRHEHDSIPNPPGPRHGKFANLGTWSVVDWQKDHPNGGRHF